MRVAQRGHATAKKRALFCKGFQHLARCLAILSALFAGGADDIEACKARNVITVLTCRADNIANVARRTTRAQKDQIVVIAMRRCGMDKAGTGIVRHMVARQHRDLMIPEAVCPVRSIERVLQNPARRVDIRDALKT